MQTKYKVTESEQLMRFLTAKMPEKSRSNIKSLLTNKQVLVNNEPISQYNYILEAGQSVEIIPLRARAQEEIRYKGLSIIFEDEHLIVINKSEGMLSISTDKNADMNAYSTLSGHVKKKSPKNKIFIVHRLDRDTSGLMIFAKNETVKNLLQETWGPTTKERVYLAVTEGVVAQESGTIESYLQETKALIVFSTADDSHGGKHAITHYEVLKSKNNHSLLRVVLDTGRKNQVRVHLKDLGHPLVGDVKYGAKTNPIKRLGLHAWVLAFKHPVTGMSMRFETPIPKKFADLF